MGAAVNPAICREERELGLSNALTHVDLSANRFWKTDTDSYMR